jgi:hypothetical protein
VSTCATRTSASARATCSSSPGAEGDGGRRCSGVDWNLGHAGALPRPLAPDRGADARGGSASRRPTTSPPTARSPRCGSRKGSGAPRSIPVVLLRHAYGLPAE